MTTSPDTRPLLAHSDTYVGLALVLTGGIAAWLASGFDAYSRTYPLVLGCLLAILGAVLILRVVIGTTTHVSFATPAQVTGAASATILLWIAALTQGLGYLLPTFLMQCAFLWLCGVRAPVKLVLIAALVAGISYLAFIEGLGVRLPRTLAPWLL
ncbi:tripartite tricarboxylate transporter TctB family protein [Roseovarius sp. SCSIO 43702]|uniref:tripartite tricarboxylate transporter TctB family protein n=1 Tax=Roseovarius sp. SCSIO 43702 TaxID=2823043 RepID=UPI001C737E77|nr:tripartite tricarboxylate transporter TctB family protein [Roseovarius sp. SCSIO 43702]QYX57595.1 tripartite tricarboxylate transporter TctB family protein [Roseovarius sp. SCSIO 43702]